ncbi:unnamed protein product [Euphydryas editha]|uniref:unspecific monooxygenase n=1 Tax=Euphydryas editha TaxID=104508 RepID=A0AAU9V3V9_EUPED|nr:unnamed protein product [Euphydryas editha]
MIVEIIIFLLTSLVFYFIYIHKCIHRYFDKMGIKYVPGVPIFGNVFKSTFTLKHFVEDLDAVYKAYPDEKYVGYIEGTTPIILVRDPELIKTITVKDFDHFVNHKEFFSPEVEPLFGGSLFSLKGERWHDMRTTLSPAFTGSKMRKMMPFMAEVSANIIEYLRDHVNEDIDVEDLIRRYTNDVIASTAFGLQVNSLKDRDNEFYKIGQDLSHFNFFQRLVFFMSAAFPNAIKKSGLQIFPPKVTNFFRNLVTSTMEHREKNNIERPDMIQLLMEASKEWTQNELAGQLFIFFIGGYETSATALVMCIHELALNPDVQEKLYQEIRCFKEKHGDLTYENMNNLKYLDCVLNETSRKWAAALILDRVCNKPYELPPPREGAKPVQLKPGDIIYNLVNSIHMDPAHHPDPEKFDPDRFSDENKHKIKPFTYMPFGMGPRNCIASRFALLELKVLIYNLILNFKVIKCSKTTDPIELNPREFNVNPKGGSWVRLEPRT